MKALENKFLIVRSGVKLTPIIEPVICALDKYFEAINKKALVTSGERNPADQLQIIRGYLLNKGLKDQFHEAFSKGVDDKVVTETYGEIYTWQLGWSKLLNIGVIINPPKQAACLLDYLRNGVNKKGLIINGSPHFRGTAFDIGGNDNGISDELPAIQKALADKLPGLVGHLPERENNAIHCDCAWLDLR
jgi:hypothetical protein